MSARSGRWSRRTTLRVLGAGGALAVTGVAGVSLAGSGRGRDDVVRDPYYPGDEWQRGTPPAVGRIGSGSSAVARENARAGSAGFGVERYRFGDDKLGQISGYASATSVQVGGTLDFHVSVAPAQRYRIQVFRLGHYGGSGARLVAASPWLAGRAQDVPTVSAERGTVRCGWDVGWRLSVGRDWVSGYHLALLTNAAGWSRFVPFVVRDPRRPAAGLVVVPTSTYQAYNMWPADGHLGASLYYGFDGARRRVPGERARAVSHDRPYQGTGIPTGAEHDIGFTQWVESTGADLTYASSEDLDTGRVDPRRYRAVVFCGHDEYWTVEMRAAVARARNGGTSLVFLGANNCYWRIRYGTPDGRHDERLVDCAKQKTRRGGPVPLTTQWRLAGSPEQELIGAQYVSMIDGRAPLVVRDTAHWFWSGTGLRDGDQIPGIVAGEADQVMSKATRPRAETHTVLAHSPFRRLGQTHHQQTTLYRASSGAWVFAAGSLGWTAGLYAEGFVDPRLRQATRNLLDRVLAERSG
ncbi:hypothetical protein O7626_09535 [Micromonospora sp. WMMD1102]|uniref:N,N-dimethylformamidase beta subunit family domain-containing protein n=1 Tax=Micromonospora sp. WMMD1102 TaxID=3016105 RepID=UPI0024157E77|nr:N,N-dimethylformamidase beta subunit family domain-containing protein [Micromonospora sp. WMMD1102]MDG4786166.1 hypothetical protein [Micromonospora sp. WMMD1102]